MINPLDEKALEEKVEERFQALSKRITDLDFVKELLKGVEKSIELFKEDVSSVKESFSFEKKEAEKKLDSIFKDLRGKEFSIEQLRSEDGICKKDISTCKNDFLDLQGQIQSQREQLVSIIHRLIGLEASKASFDSFKADMAKQVSLLKSTVDKTNAKVDSLPDFSQRVSSLEKESLELRKKIDDYKNELSLSIDHTKNYLNKEISELKYKISEEISRNRSLMEEKFSLLPDFSQFVKAHSFDKLAENIEILMLDSKNAMLKASNVDIQNQIQAKKIENLQLQLRNNEIKNG